MSGLYDFSRDLDQLRFNYESYDEKIKKALDNQQFDYNRNQNVSMINQDVNQGQQPLPVKNNSFGDLSGITNIFGSKKQQNPTQNMDMDNDGIPIGIDARDEAAGIYGVGQPENKTSSVGASASSSGGGAKFGVGEAMGVAEFGIQAGNVLSNTSEKEAEGWANMGNLTMKGASVGMQIGGPWGAAIGGVIGLGTGVYDMFADASKRKKMNRDKYDKMLEANKTKREQEQRMKDGQESLEKLNKLRKAQLNYLDLKY